jgi:hypothetical protein
VIAAIARHDTPHLFGWLMSILSFQGISYQVAENFIHKHGNVTWTEIELALAEPPSCPLLGGYWRFDNCRYHKTSGSCAQPDHTAACPLPRHPLRNGRLNQTAYSLFLFIRDIADGDLVDWIDRQIANVAAECSQQPTLKARDALIGPLRNVYGISDKVIAMALSMLLIGAGPRKRQWFEIGASFIVVRYPGPQFPAPNRDSASGQCPPSVWARVLSAERVLRRSRRHRSSYRCEGFQ